MIDHCDFYEQESVSAGDGRLRPDMIVRLPGDKQIVVDAKAPVQSYLDATEADSEEARRAGLSQYAAQVRAHIASLGRKAYWEQFDRAPEFAVLFLPGEMFFSAALQQDPALIEFGVNEKVIPATPTTLIALLRAVSYGWRQEALAKNAQEICQLGNELYKRLADLSNYWTDLGKKLGGAVDSFDRATRGLESRVLVSARRFRELQAAPGGVDIELQQTLERSPRSLQAPELGDSK